MKLRIKAILAAALMAAGCIFCTGCTPQIMVAVLSAIIAPTMTGYVQSSRVTSADSTAAQIRNNTTTFLTKLDTNGITMTYKDDFTILISVDSSGEWDLYGTLYGGDWSDGVDHWGASTDYSTDTDNEYAAFMQDMFIDLTNCYAEVHFSNGKCIGVSCVPETDGVPNATLPSIDDFKAGYTNAFDDEAGYCDGVIVGTAPVLGMAY